MRLSLEPGGWARLALLALLVLAAFDPSPPWQAPPRDTVVVLDVSASVDSGARDQALERAMSSFDARPTDLQAALVTFGARARVAAPLQPWQPDLRQRWRSSLGAAQADEGASDISAGLETGLRLLAPAREGRLLLLTDGHENRREARERLAQARRAGVEVELVELPLRAANSACRVDRVDLPDRVDAGRAIGAGVYIAGTPGASGSLRVSDGRLASSHGFRLDPAGQAYVALHLEPAPAGTVRVDLSLAGEGCERRTHARIVNVVGRRPVVYAAATDTPFSRALRDAGWPLLRIDPPRLGQALAAGAGGLVILDDVPAADITADSVAALGRALERGSVGLLTLGGPHSFSAGGYRHSALEALLPVIAEGRDPLGATAVMFAIDTSGSMATVEHAAERLALAREAVRETARSLRPEDAVGLLGFDIDARLLIPLGQHPDLEQRLPAALASRASGGTRIVPALEMAVSALASAPQRQRVLVVVTDARLEDEPLGTLEARIRAQGIDVMAIEIGPAGAPGVLDRLAALNRGRVLRVMDSAELPRFMRSEFESLRPGVQYGPVDCRFTADTPFAPRLQGACPALDAYMVTAARPIAEVYVQSGLGDPLFATMRVGAGVSAVLPAGLGSWAGGWLKQPQAGPWLAGLSAWLSADEGALWAVRQALAGDRLTLIVEAGADASGTEDGPARVLLEDPLGGVREVALQAVAAGRWEATATLGATGLYRATAVLGQHRVQHALMYSPDEEWAPPRAPSAAVGWKADGLVGIGHDAGEPAQATGGGSRAPLLLVCLGLYLVLLLVERLPAAETAARAAALARRLIPRRRHDTKVKT